MKKKLRQDGHFSIPVKKHSANSKTKNEKISVETLRKIVYYALTHNLSLNILVGNEPLSDELKAELEYCNYVILRSTDDKQLGARSVSQTSYGFDIFDYENGTWNNSHCENLILRMEREHLPKLPQWLAEHSLAYSRISLIIKDLDKAMETDNGIYDDVLKKIADWLPEREEEKPLELSFLTDRLILAEPNHCDAGIKHVTVVPDGGLYLCPGFYYDGEKPFTDIETVLQTHELPIPNRQLLRLDYAPICEKCDAYQCKRCVYLNKKTTLDINTPSRQQCVFSHLERNISRTLIEPLFLTDDVSIPEIDYIDPFDKLQAKDKSKADKMGEC